MAIQNKIVLSFTLFHFGEFVEKSLILKINGLQYIETQCLETIKFQMKSCWISRLNFFLIIRILFKVSEVTRRHWR